ncbi:MAG: metal-dependent hydrolase [Planctomycetota bacterium]
MPSPIAHGSLTMLAQPALGPAYRRAEQHQQALLSFLALFACGAPDLDIFIGIVVDGDAFLNHGTWTHSLVLAPVFGVAFAIAAGFLCPLFKKTEHRMRAFAVGTSLYALHVGMDFITIGSRGVSLYWPFTAERVVPPFGVFTGVEHGDWTRWDKHLITVGTELAFAAVIWAIARRVNRSRRLRRARP